MEKGRFAEQKSVQKSLHNTNEYLPILSKYTAQHHRKILSLSKQSGVIYIGVALLHRSSGTPACAGTALHPGKDLAVSPSSCDEIIPQTACAGRGTLVFRHRRHCSHLYGYPRRVLPATLLTLHQGGSSDFPHLAI